MCLHVNYAQLPINSLQMVEMVPTMPVLVNVFSEYVFTEWYNSTISKWDLTLEIFMNFDIIVVCLLHQ